MASFFVRKGKRGWRLIEESWKDGEKSQRAVAREVYSSLGFSFEMTLEQARDRASQLNKLKTIEKKEANGAARRAKFEVLVEAAFIDKTLAMEFAAKLIDENFGNEDNEKRLIHQWTATQKLITQLKLEPHNFSDSSKAIYKYFVQQQFSVDYSNRLIRILNLWGSFICRKQNRHFEQLKRPSGQVREAINSSYLSKSSSRPGGSRPLAPRLLAAKQSEFTIPGNYEWLFVTLWLGLRPEEVTNKIEVTTDINGIKILHVYQSKLTSLKEKDRWKLIPLLFKEQEVALSYLQEGKCKRPLLKTIKRVLGEGYELYAGRKGFTDMMLDKGQDLEAISAWLGHRTIDRTWRHYKNRNRVQYKKPAG